MTWKRKGSPGPTFVCGVCGGPGHERCPPACLSHQEDAYWAEQLELESMYGRFRHQQPGQLEDLMASDHLTRIFDSMDSQESPAHQEDPAKKRRKPKRKEVDRLMGADGSRDKPTANRHGSRAKAATLKDADFERAIQASQELDITMDCDGTDLTHDGCSKLLAGVRDLQAGVQTLPAAQVRDLLICNKFPEPVQAFIGINKDPSLNFPLCIS